MNRKRSRKMVFKSLGLIGSQARMAASLIAVMVLCTTASFAGVNEDLILAANRGNLSEVQRLLAEGAEVNAKKNDGATALMAASEGGRLEVVQALLAKGAEVNAKKRDGATALILASQKGHREVSAMLIKAGAK
jgi:ankyrin repeat protein